MYWVCYFCEWIDDGVVYWNCMLIEYFEVFGDVVRFKNFFRFSRFGIVGG